MPSDRLLQTRRVLTLVAIAVPAVLMLNACSGERPVLGVKDGLLTACPSSPNCVSSFAADERHGIAALAFRDDAEAAFSRLERVLRTRDDTRIVEKREGYLRVELRTTLFVDDGEFLLDRERQAIQVRSASRVGYSDLGKNRRRLEEIRRGFEAEAPSRGAGASGRDR